MLELQGQFSLRYNSHSSAITCFDVAALLLDGTVVQVQQPQQKFKHRMITVLASMTSIILNYLDIWQHSDTKLMMEGKILQLQKP